MSRHFKNPGRRWFPRLGLITLAVAMGMLLTGLSAVAQDNPAPERTAETTANPSIDSHRLKVLLRPLTAEQLQVELDAWIELLQMKIAEVGRTELFIEDMDEEEDTPDTASEEAGAAEEIAAAAPSSMNPWTRGRPFQAVPALFNGRGP